MTTDTQRLKSNAIKGSGKSFEWLLSAINHKLKSAAELGFNSSVQSFEKALSNSHKALQKSARETPQQSDKEQFIIAMEIGQNNKQALINQFKQHLTAAYTLLAHQESATLTAKMLSEDNKTANRIILQQIEADAQRHFEKGVSASTAYLQNSLQGLSITNQNNPFGSYTIIECSQKALSSEAFSQKAMQTLLLHFQQDWFNHLGDFYSALNKCLGQSGINFNSKNQLTRSQPNETNTTFKLDTVDTEKIEFTPLFNDVSSEIADVTDAIGLIQNATIPPSMSQKNYKTLASTAPDNSLELSTHAVIGLIADMQKGYEPNSDGDVIRYIRQQLSLLTNNNQAVIISQTDENTINLISLSFRAIATPLPKDLVPLLLRLKPAYARIALDDGFFFHDNLHPARKLLDQLLSLINSNFNDKTINRYVRTIVLKVQMKFTGDTSLFDQLLSDIEGYLEQEKSRSKNNQADLIKQFSDQENQQMAISVCKKYLQEYIGTLSTQLEFFDYMNVILSPVLAKVYLKHGEKSETWQAIDKSIQFVFSMLACADVDELRSQARTLATISAQLSQLLSNAKVPIINKNMLLEPLQDIQILQMKGKSLSSIYDSQLKNHTQISEYLNKHQPKVKQSFNSSFIGHQHQQLKTAQFARFHNTLSDLEAKKTCKQLRIGQWLCMLIDQKATRLQYGFYSRVTDHFVFFNSHHEKAFERSAADLQQDFSTGFACLIEHTANFDTALEQVSKDLALRRA